MSPALFFALLGAALFGIGLYGFLAHSHLLRKVLASNVMVNGIFLILIALARRDPAAVDPVPHAMVLTGIVISVSTTAFALALIKKLYRADSPGEVPTAPRDEDPGSTREATGR
jgi:multicomponent Na+:H+ antiporter subunit C